MSAPLKIYTDANDRKSNNFASRNFQHFCTDGGAPIGDKAELEFKVGLRQKMLQKSAPQSPAVPPHLSVPRTKSLPPESAFFFNDPPYDETKYGNVSSTAHALIRPFRFAPHTSINWQIHLRNDSTVDKPITITHSRVCDKERTHTDRENTDYACKRFPGCEGSSSSQWQHLFASGKNRNILAWETTLRGHSDARINEALTELIGKKPKIKPRPTDSITSSDPKLTYLR